MPIRFTKMQGAGNDYIYFDAFERRIENPAELAVRLSDRHFGVGGDGVVVIEPSARADAFMRMFNADGSEGNMCGNAIRCVAKHLADSGRVSGDSLKIDTLSGIKSVEVFRGKSGKVDSARVDMGKYSLRPEDIPVNLPGDSVAEREVEIAGGKHFVTCVSMGNPHCVLFTEDIDGLDLEKTGPKFEHSPLFPNRVNTEFVEVLGKNRLKMRVWERGSGETLACGTGACAAAVAAVLAGSCEMGEDITVSLRGGALTIRVTEDKTVYMTGDAVKVFEGEIEAEELNI